MEKIRSYSGTKFLLHCHFLSFRDFNSFVPGVEDLINGNAKYGIIPMQEKIDKGKIAINALGTYKKAKKNRRFAHGKECFGYASGKLEIFWLRVFYFTGSNDSKCPR